MSIFKKTKKIKSEYVYQLIKTIQVQGNTVQQEQVLTEHYILTIIGKKYFLFDGNTNESYTVNKKNKELKRID